MRKSSLREIINLNTYWLGLQFMWTSLHVIVLPALMLQYVPDERKNTALGLLTFLGYLIAAIIQPLSGAISDRWASSWGRRRPAIAFGTLSDMIFLALLAFAGGIPLLAVGYIGLQLTSNIAHGPAQGLMHDKIPLERMGLASGVKSFFDMAGVAAASVIMGRVFTAEEPLGAFGWIALVLAIGAAFTLFGVREESTVSEKEDRSLVEILRSEFQIDLRQHGPYWRLLFARFLFLAGVYGILAFAQYFIRDTLRVEDPIQFTSNMMAGIVLSLMVFAVLAGQLTDRIGRKPMHVLAGVMVCVGSIMLTIFRAPTAILVFAAIVGAGAGIFLSSNWALANDFAPRGESGKFLGLTNLATAGAGAISRLLGPIIDFGNNLRPGEYLGYNVLFIGAAVMALLCMQIVRGVPEKIHQHNT
jgi:MFS family permease